jgi:LacI family transcriptional regulator
MAANPRRGKHATLREVAAAAETSLATASRALAGHAYVGDAIRLRVQQAARELGYRPHEGARGLRTSRSMTLGVLCYQLRQLPIVDFIDGYGARAGQEGYAVLVANARGDDGEYQLLARRLLERRIDGLIVTSPGDLGGSLKPYQAAGVPVAVTLWRAPNEAEIPLITTSELAATRDAFFSLREFGHTSVAFFGTPRTAFMQRPSTLMQASLDTGLRCHMSFIEESTSAEDMVRQIEQVLMPPVSATAICFNHSHTSSVLRAIRLLGLKAPEDLSVFVFTDYSDRDGLLQPTLSAVHTDVVRMGVLSAEIMLSWIASEEPPAGVTDLDLTTWVATDSIGPAKQLKR